MGQAALYRLLNERPNEWDGRRCASQHPDRTISTGV